jgi:hypothetical protein
VFLGRNTLKLNASKGRKLSFWIRKEAFF